MIDPNKYLDGYYTLESIADLAMEVNNATDSIKYAFNIPAEDPNKSLITPELLEEYRHLAEACELLTRAYNYYNSKNGK